MLLAASLFATTHVVLQSPTPRTDNDYLYTFDGSCDGAQCDSFCGDAVGTGPVTTLTPGPLTVRWRVAQSHPPYKFRISLNRVPLTDDNFDDPANLLGVHTGTQEYAYDTSHEVIIPETPACEHQPCTLQLYDLYYFVSCANVRIITPSSASVAPPPSRLPPPPPVSSPPVGPRRLAAAVLHNVPHCSSDRPGSASHRTLVIPVDAMAATTDADAAVWTKRLCCVFTWVELAAVSASHMTNYDSSTIAYSGTFQQIAAAAYRDICNMPMGESDCAGCPALPPSPPSPPPPSPPLPSPPSPSPSPSALSSSPPPSQDTAILGAASLIAGSGAASASARLVVGEESSQYWSGVRSSPDSRLEVAVGTSLEFRYNYAHDLWLLPGEKAYRECDFSAATQLAGLGQGGGQGTWPNLYEAPLCLWCKAVGGRRQPRSPLPTPLPSLRRWWTGPAYCCLLALWGSLAATAAKVSGFASSSSRHHQHPHRRRRRRRRHRRPCLRRRRCFHHTRRGRTQTGT